MLQIEIGVDASSLQITDHTSREFTQTTEQRIYMLSGGPSRHVKGHPQVIEIGEVADRDSSITALLVGDLRDDVSTWDTVDDDDWWLPAHSHWNSLKWPVSELYLDRGVAAGCEAAAVMSPWGWAAVPDVVHEAAILASSRITSREDSPLGTVQGGTSPDAGVVHVRPLDPDVKRMLRPYRRGGRLR